jgi:hypothetical protein
MSLEHNHYVVPKPNSFTPDADQLLSFLHEAESCQRLRSQYPGWIAKSQTKSKIQRETIRFSNAADEVRKHWDCGIRMSWPVWWPNGEVPYDLELHVSPEDYIYHISESVNPFGESVDCRQCGTRLDYEPQTYLFGTFAIHATCPRCGTFFDPSEWPVTYTEGWTGDKTTLLGGATYRFALILGNIPDDEQENFKVDPQLMELCKRTFGCNFYDFADFS